MGTLGNPQTWPPYENIKDCSQGFCSFNCPQWCYIIFPPPPPLAFSDDDSKTNFSPLVIAIIGILASAFLLVSYYTVISKYCGNLDSSRRNANRDQTAEDGNEEEDRNQNNELWHVSNSGLEESLIKLITVCKYKRGDGLVEGTDCSVCLSEFEENEKLRLLPKCSHAFHLSCIDTWLKSHSNCPLCRANVIVTCPPAPLPPLSLPSPPNTQDATSPENQQADENHTVVMIEDVEEEPNAVAPKTYRDDVVIEIRPIRRSVSMDYSLQGRVSLADVLSTSEEDEESDIERGESSSKEQGSGENSNANSSSRGNKRRRRNSRVLHYVASPTPMKRSFSSGRFTFTRQR